jgi:hypothetical protein
LAKATVVALASSANNRMIFFVVIVKLLSCAREVPVLLKIAPKQGTARVTLTAAMLKSRRPHPFGPDNHEKLTPYEKLVRLPRV